MKIYITPITAGIYGGRFYGNLQFFSRFIENEINEKKIKTSFNELWISFYYPRFNKVPQLGEVEFKFNNFYETLPKSTFYRKNKKIEIALKTPEFSKHFESSDSNNEKKKQVDDEVELAKYIIDKYLEAGEIIKSKLKTGDEFDYENYTFVLQSLKEKIDQSFLISNNTIQSIKNHDEILNKAMSLRESRKKMNILGNQLIRDIRVYTSGLPKKIFYPYDYQYLEIFLNLLQMNGLMCPIYHHLYIQVANNKEEALKSSIPMADWYTSGIASVDINEYQHANSHDKADIVFNLIIDGLRDIADIDKLDNSVIEKTIEQIKIKGLETELIFKIIENKKYILKITYLSRSIEDECPIFLDISERVTSKSNKIQLTKADNTQLGYLLKTIKLTKTSIKIIASNSVNAQVYLKDKPKSIQINIKDILK